MLKVITNLKQFLSQGKVLILKSKKYKVIQILYYLKKKMKKRAKLIFPAKWYCIGQFQVILKVNVTQIRKYFIKLKKKKKQSQYLIIYSNLIIYLMVQCIFWENQIN